jgi:Ni/Co efflux regulator RcnB
MMKLHRFIQGITLVGSLLLPLALSAQDPAQDRTTVRQSRHQVRADRKAALQAPVGSKSADRQAARQDRQTVRPQRRGLRQDRRAVVR